LFALLAREHAVPAAGAEALCRRSVRRELRPLRPGDDPVPHLRAARPHRHLAPHPELLSPVAVPPPRVALMQTAPLLAVDKLEVVYHRAITAVQGITLAAE